ncbi:23S rRNA (pseudouridine(1915)-N(3))-methyltransferase RlmH [Syntrophomonas palmitatica]|uniref:23S rRNA (pseudouridine(1915)-N(3))-methyltransferase RlmH n=1 Tax=Syntrophomonas palmitatica TaxID=402877 RepID=UPI0006D11F2C|nr:23S rRNA (pseudouridine(1915)-N(3))-methyltransferase RlmH [Syntrophomonas palmitatica]
MKYRIISIGKIREPFFQQGIQEYLKRLQPYASIELVDGLEEKLSPRAGDKDIEKALQREGERILALINDNELLIALDIKGRMLSSEALAHTMEAWNQSGKSRVNFVIGSSFGLSPAVKTRADLRLCLSPMTFLHQMSGLILAEQIYRGFRIIKGEPYHK